MPRIPPHNSQPSLTSEGEHQPTFLDAVELLLKAANYAQESSIPSEKNSFNNEAISSNVRTNDLHSLKKTKQKSENEES